MTELCPEHHPEVAPVRELIAKIKADQTARAEAYIKRAGGFTLYEAVDLLTRLQNEQDQDTARDLGRVVVLLLTWSEALAIKRIP